MNAIVLAVLGLGMFFLGYRFYSRFIAEKIFQLDPDFVTPAHEFEDGVDFVPTNRYILWGHHFTSVAGAAPIVGPAIAVLWGWLPAFIWVTLGTIFFAGVHDAGALWASVRNRARSIGALTEDIVGGRARSLFMIIIFLLLLMVNAVFAIIIADLFVSVPSSVVPAWSVIAVALVIGYLLYKRGVGLLGPSIVALVVLYGAIFLGESVPIEMPQQMFGLASNAQWVILLFVYAGVASVLPVWLLLQPRDYINSLQLFVGLILLYGAVFLSNPTVVAPALTDSAIREYAPGPLIPLLFVTIACGAISGFHGLVSSGTTSKQLDKETDVRFVGYLGAIGEGTLALAAILATTAGFASMGEWEQFYIANGGNVNAWVVGGGALVSNGLGLPVAFAETLLAVMAILFAATTMDTGVRLQRYIVQEWGQIYNLEFLTGRFISTLVAVGCCVALAFGSGEGGSGGLIIWPLFGTTNQLLAALTMLILSVALMKLGRPVVYTLAPLAFLLVMTVFALVAQLRTFYEQGNFFLIFVDLLILVATIWVGLEALGALKRARHAKRQTAEELFASAPGPGE